MFKRCFLVASFSITALFMSTAIPTDLAADEAKKAELIYSNAILWKLEKEGSIRNHLFGTFHVPDRAVVRIPKEVRKALDGSSIAAFEIINEMKGTFGDFKNPTLLTDGRSLQEILDPELYQQVVDMFETADVPERYVFLLKPWAAAWFGGIDRERRALLRAGRPRLDDYLMQEAMKIGMKLEPLERRGERVFGFDMLPEDDQIKMLKHALATYKDGEARSKRMVKMYLDRDVVGLIEESKKQFGVMSKESADLIWEQFLVKRNIRMVDAALPLMKGGGLFIGVGTAHLPGEGGMVQLFEKEGFTVTPVY